MARKLFNRDRYITAEADNMLGIRPRISQTTPEASFRFKIITAKSGDKAREPDKQRHQSGWKERNSACISTLNRLIAADEPPELGRYEPALSQDQSRSAGSGATGEKAYSDGPVNTAMILVVRMPKSTMPIASSRFEYGF